MEKRYLRSNRVIKQLVLICFFTILLCISIRVFETGTLKSQYISSKRAQYISKSKVCVEEPLVDTIVFNDQILLYDSASSTYYYSLNDGIESYDPQIKLEDSSVKIYFCGEQLTEEFIKSGKTIDMFIVQGHKYNEAHLAVTTLPIMNIKVVTDEKATDDIIEAMEDDELPMELYLYDNRAEIDGKVDEKGELESRSIVSDGKIRLRGQTSRAWDANNFRLTLLKNKKKLDGENRSENLLGIRNDDDYILTSTFADYDKVRNVFVTNLWETSFATDNEWKVNNSIHYEFLELFINDQYYGLYTLTSPYDEKQVDAKYSFKKKDWTMSEFYNELEYNEGGDYDWLPGYYQKQGSSEGYEELLNLYNMIVYSGDNEAIRSSVDMNTAIDLWLYFKFTQAVDNIYGNNVKNIYVSIMKSDTGINEEKILFFPWDMDQTWNYWMEPTDDNPIYFSPITYLMFYKDENICDEIKEKYYYLRNNQWSDDSINQMLDEYEKQIFDSGAYIRNMNRWPNGNYLDGVYDMSRFRAYVLDRAAWMDEFIPTLDNNYLMETENE